MLYTIENERYRLSAKEMGAELSSVQEKSTGYEYIWQSCDIWQGQSPLLFPIVGKLRDDTYILDGRQYHLNKHGFAKRMDFALESREGSRMTFFLKDTPETYEAFPFRFELRVEYRLTRDGFVMEYRARNADEKTMYFSIGAHPGFQCAMGDRLVMDEDEEIGAYKLVGNLRTTYTIPAWQNHRELVITPEIFAEDALIFDGIRSRGATLMRQNGKNVHVDFGGAPCLGVWAKPAAEYVCIEPWYGIDDRQDANVDFPRKERILCLSAGEEFVYPVTIRF